MAKMKIVQIGTEKGEGNVAHGAGDLGNPVSMGLNARTGNPTSVGNDTRVRAIGDDVGRMITYPYQVRDLVNTAYVSLTTGTVANLLAGVTDVFLDLVEISFSNNSAAVDVLLQDSSTTVQIFQVPANSTVSYTFPVPIRQSATGDAWNVDMDDVTGTSVRVQAQFIRNV